MKITFTTYCSKEYSPLGNIVLPNRRAYCERHGYDLVVHDTPLSDRHTGWDKLAIIKQALATSEVVVWNGADVVVMNQDFRVETLLARYPKASVILTTDLYGLNSDNIILRSDPWAEQLIYAVWTFGYTLFRNHVWSEQEAFIRFTSAAPYSNHVVLTEQNVMNSYINSLYGRPSNWPGDYRPGDWLVHLPGLPMEQRIAAAKKLVAFANTPAASARQPTPTSIAA